MKKLLTYCCPCHFGLERTLRFEITKIGGQNITVQDGRVLFEGDLSVLAKANLCLSTAERVLIQMGQFPAYQFEDLFQGVKKLPWEEFIGKQDAFPVKGHALADGNWADSSGTIHHPQKSCNHLLGHFRNRPAQAWIPQACQRCSH